MKRSRIAVIKSVIDSNNLFRVTLNIQICATNRKDSPLIARQIFPAVFQYLLLLQNRNFIKTETLYIVRRIVINRASVYTKRIGSDATDPTVQAYQRNPPVRSAR